MNPNDDFKDYGMVRINIKGEYQLNTAYTEITRLHNLLANNQIPHDFHRLYDGWQICYPSDKNIIISAIQHYGSYGAANNRIEIMGGIVPDDGTMDSVLGHLTAENVFGRIVTMYKTKQGRCKHETD